MHFSCKEIYYKKGSVISGYSQGE